MLGCDGLLCLIVAFRGLPCFVLTFCFVFPLLQWKLVHTSADVGKIGLSFIASAITLHYILHSVLCESISLRSESVALFYFMLCSIRLHSILGYINFYCILLHHLGLDLTASFLCLSHVLL